MKRKSVFTVPFRRKREGRTYYKKRLKILMSNEARFVIRKSLSNLQASIVKYGEKGDKVIFTVNSRALNKLGWKGGTRNLPSSYLTGMIAGKKAVQLGINRAISDLGFNNAIKGSRLFAVVAGAIDAGLEIPFDSESLPPKERISGEHITKYAQSLKKDKDLYQKRFADYIKRGLDPGNIVNHFNEIKSKING